MTHHLIPQTSYFDSSGYRSPWRAREDQLPIACDHEPVDRFLCSACTDVFAAALADVPSLCVDLELAITRQTAFVAHGSIGAPPERDVADEGAASSTPLPYDPAASAALGRLARSLTVPVPGESSTVARKAVELRHRLRELLLDPDVAQLAGRISYAVLHARRVIDRPPDPWYFGACPNGHDLYDDRDITHITCGRCDYAATIADHRLACLNAGDDRMLTVTELVGAITSTGETVTRRQILYWIEREGIVREIENRATFRKGRLESHEVYVYCLGQVRRLALRAERGRVA